MNLTSWLSPKRQTQRDVTGDDQCTELVVDARPAVEYPDGHPFDQEPPRSRRPTADEGANHSEEVQSNHDQEEKHPVGPTSPPRWFVHRSAVSQT